MTSNNLNKRQHKKRKPEATTPDRPIKLHILGSAGDVTGSFILFELSFDGKLTRFLLEVGLHQSDPHTNRQRRLPKGIEPSDIAFAIISHAHIDHSGWLPALIKAGFRGPVYTHPATIDLLKILLPDSGRLQEFEADRINRRLRRKASSAGASRPDNLVEPIYNEDDAWDSLQYLKPISYNVETTLADGVSVKFTEASHILGAAVVTLTLGKGAAKRVVCFTGNIGRPNTPILRALEPVHFADYVITESTYGNRLHDKGDRLDVLADIINRAHARASEPHKKYGYGVIVIPAFAVGRVQTVLFELRKLMEAGRIPEMPVFLDSPMAIKATHAHRAHPELFNAETAEVAATRDPFATPRFAELDDKTLSDQLDGKVSEPTIIIGSSGMAAGGRILKRLKTRLPGRQNTVIFVGYQGTGVLGYKLVNQHPSMVRVFGDLVRVGATIEYMPHYSGHADYEEIVGWLSNFRTPPRETFIVHGDPEAMTGLQGHVTKALGWNVTIPGKRQSFELK